jgi:ABC-type cobalamin transport system ATPase subunit
MQKTSHILDDRTGRVVRDATSGQEWLALRLVQLLRVVARQPDEFDRLASADEPNAKGIHSAPQGSLDQTLLKRRREGSPPRQPAALQ